MPTQSHRLEFHVELGFGLKVEAFPYDGHIWSSKESQDCLEELESRKNKFDVLCLREFPSYKAGSKVVHFEQLSQNVYMEISILYKIFIFSVKKYIQISNHLLEKIFGRRNYHHFQGVDKNKDLSYLLLGELPFLINYLQ